MTDRCDKIEEKVDHFVSEVYAKNNKEFLQLSFFVNELRDDLKEYMRSAGEYKKEREGKEDLYHKSVEEKLKTIEARILPFTILKTSSGLLYKFILGLAGLIVAMSGAYFYIKKLFE